MLRSDPTSEVLRLERGMRDAEERFLHAPGGLWLAASATLEALGRIAPSSIDGTLRERMNRLAHEARRMKAEGDARASEHELTALAEWVELARHRVTHEEAFLAASANAPRRFASRAELTDAVLADERALESLAREPGAPLAASTDALVARLRTAYPDYDPHVLPEALVLARGRAALRELGPGAGHASAAVAPVTWSARPFPSSVALLAGAAASLALSIGAFATLGALADPATLASVAAGLAVAAVLLGISIVRRRSEMGRRVVILEAWGYRARSSRSLDEARAKHERWVAIARALGQLDAFRRSEEGVLLEAREQRLPALSPWIRALVGGLDEDHARRFEG